MQELIDKLNATFAEPSFRYVYNMLESALLRETESVDGSGNYKNTQSVIFSGESEEHVKAWILKNFELASKKK